MSVSDIPPFDLVWPFVAIALILLALQSLWLVFLREAVKADLYERTFRPVSIRWIPFCPTSPEYPLGGTGFRVVYEDWEGRVHKAGCIVRQHWQYGRRIVVWTRDDVVSEHGANQEPQG
jgi:hypothetical protein